MILVMRRGAPPDQVEEVIQQVKDLGLSPQPLYGVERTVIAVIGDERPFQIFPWERLAGVETAMTVLHPFKLASRDFQTENTVISLDGVKIGGEAITVMAGPCAIENEAQIVETARAVKKAGVKILRGGAFKPRTSPYSFQGLEEEGLKLMKLAKEETGLHLVTEVIAPEDVPLVAEYVDILQIGTRNMHNYRLLQAVGQTKHPVVLKRGMSSKIDEWLMAAEYILGQGNPNVILCERGIRTFETATRNTVDLNAVALVKELSHLPVIVDPSHGTGKWRLVAPIAKAAIAAGADGLIIEVHPNPSAALSDGMQSLKPDVFGELINELRRVAEAVDRKL